MSPDPCLPGWLLEKAIVTWAVHTSYPSGPLLVISHSGSGPKKKRAQQMNLEAWKQDATGTLGVHLSKSSSGPKDQAWGGLSCEQH
jgi:hypothetical protein